MKFPKGKSGNPSGRRVETEKQKNTAKLLLTPLVEDAVKQVARSAKSPDPHDHQWAINLLFSYLFPKPAQEVDIGGKDGIIFRLVIEGEPSSGK